MSESRLALVEALCAAGMSCLEAPDGNRAWNCFRSDRPDLVVSALLLPGLNGLDFLARVRRASDVPFIIQIPYGEIPAAVEAVRGGAADVIPLPCEPADLSTRIKAFITSALGGFGVAGKFGFTGRTHEATVIRARIRALAGLRIPVLFRGEKGTGRAHAARSLVAADGAHPQQLVRVGALEGSRRRQDDVTKIIYLDEIDQFSKIDQAYWLERIEASERGEPHSPRRIMASTTCDLDALSRSTHFDRHLARCLLRFAIGIPPLRDRLDDIPPLVENLSASISARIGRRRIWFSASALRLLQAQSWPGNVAQLVGVIEKLIAFAPDGLITKRGVLSALTECPASVDSLRQIALHRQRDELIAMLDATGGNLAETARRMNMSRGAIIYRAQKFGLLSKRVRTEPVPRRPRASAP